MGIIKDEQISANPRVQERRVRKNKVLAALQNNELNGYLTRGIKGLTVGNAHEIAEAILHLNTLVQLHEQRVENMLKAANQDVVIDRVIW